MDAPVVVNPETVSKRASAKVGIKSDTKNGSEPKIHITIHERATVMYPSFAYIYFDFGGLYVKRTPKNRQMALHVTNKSLYGSP